MKQVLLIVIISYLFCTSCQKEKISVGTQVSETFYVENNGASMPVLVEGNTASRVFLIFVHGGPGASSLIYNTDYISQHIENNFAVVYWDQRNAGASQGNSNGKYLNLAQMTDDLKKVIQVIKSRYGENSSVFILGHSFGGLLTSSFMTTGNNQSMVKGWIFVDGSHNYPLNDTLTRQMLMTVGQQQVDLNKNSARWQTIISYCINHPGNFSKEESYQLGYYAADAETYMDEVEKIDMVALSQGNAIKGNWPLTSILFNYLYSLSADFNDDLLKTSFSSSLGKIVTPTLILFGKFDFICPTGMGYDLFNRISSPDKKIVISPISGHEPMFQDEVLFCQEINDFIELHK